MCVSEGDIYCILNCMYVYCIILCFKLYTPYRNFRFYFYSVASQFSIFILFYSFLYDKCIRGEWSSFVYPSCDEGSLSKKAVYLREESFEFKYFPDVL